MGSGYSPTCDWYVLALLNPQSQKQAGDWADFPLCFCYDRFATKMTHLVQLWSWGNLLTLKKHSLKSDLAIVLYVEDNTSLERMVSFTASPFFSVSFSCFQLQSVGLHDLKLKVTTWYHEKCGYETTWPRDESSGRGVGVTESGSRPQGQQSWCHIELAGPKEHTDRIWNDALRCISSTMYLFRNA